MIFVSLVAAIAVLRPIPSVCIPIRWSRRDRPLDVLLIARLLSLSVAAGRPIGSGLQDIAGLLPPPEAAAVESVVARMRTMGVARALVETRGPLIDLTARLAQAHLSGAPTSESIETFITSTRDAERYRSVEEARVVGVKLTLPLTLLLLPGFILLTIAPFVMDQLGPLIGSAR